MKVEITGTLDLASITENSIILVKIDDRDKRLSPEIALELSKQLKFFTNGKCLVSTVPIEHITEEDMNRMGWYRKSGENGPPETELVEIPIYSHPECVFNYCPFPDQCRPGCKHPAD